MKSLHLNKKNKEYIKFTVLFKKDKSNDIWIATCKELGIVIQSKSLEESSEIIGEAIELFIRSVYI